MKFLDLFAGIGGFRLGMEQAGHECVGYVEWDKYARKSYEAIHDTEGEWTAHDITTISDEEIRSLGERNIDVICGGFPCQSFSVAGRRMGFEDTRGTLFFEIARIAKEIKPRYLLLENVKGLLNHDKGNTFSTILRALDELGYDVEWQVLNSKNFGVPQNRERVFIIGHLRGSGGREVFPIGESDTKTKVEIAGSTKGEENTRLGQRDAVYSPDGLMGCLAATDYKQPKQIIQAVLTPGRAEKQQNGRRFKEDGEPMFTLTAQDKHGVMIREATKKGFDVAYPGDSVNYSIPTSKTRRGRVGDGIANTLDTGCQQGVVTEEYRIRKLTPKECWRLQSFPDSAFDKASEVNSDSQLYKQAGNSVTVNVVNAIAKRLN